MQHRPYPSTIDYCHPMNRPRPERTTAATRLPRRRDQPAQRRPPHAAIMAMGQHRHLPLGRNPLIGTVRQARIGRHRCVVDQQIRPHNGRHPLGQTGTDVTHSPVQPVLISQPRSRRPGLGLHQLFRPGRPIMRRQTTGHMQMRESGHPSPPDPFQPPPVPRRDRQIRLHHLTGVRGGQPHRPHGLFHDLRGMLHHPRPPPITIHPWHRTAHHRVPAGTPHHLDGHPRCANQDRHLFLNILIHHIFEQTFDLTE